MTFIKTHQSIFGVSPNAVYQWLHFLVHQSPEYADIVIQDDDNTRELLGQMTNDVVNHAHITMNDITIAIDEHVHEDVPAVQVEQPEEKQPTVPELHHVLVHTEGMQMDDEEFRRKILTDASGTVGCFSSGCST